MDRICTKCGEIKPPDCFGKHSDSNDGVRRQCKECRRIHAKERRRGNDELRERDNARKCRARLSNERRLRENELLREKYRTSDALRWKSKVRSALSSAIKTHRLTPCACEKCGEEKTQAHHDSYAWEDRLKVRWLCTKCHAEHHRDFGKMSNA